MDAKTLHRIYNDIEDELAWELMREHAHEKWEDMAPAERDQWIRFAAALAARAPSSGEPAPPDLERAAQIADEWAKHPSCTPGQPCEHQRTAAAIAERIRALPPAPSAGEAAPASVSDAMLETLAERVHTAYLETCARLGWSVSPANAVPYAELSDAAKELDRATVRAVLSALPVAPDRAPYDPAFGDDRECVCGHRYVRHFDTYDAMRPIGCKLCACEAWRASSAGEAPPVEPQEQRGDRESPDTPPSNALAGINTRRGTGHIGEAALRTAHAAAPAPVEPPQVAPPDRAQVEPRGQQGPILSAGPVSGPTCPTCCGHDHSKDGDALAVLASESAAVQRMLKEHDREGLAAYVNRHARARAQHAAEKVREISSELASSAAQGEPRGEGRAEGGDGRWVARTSFAEYDVRAIAEAGRQRVHDARPWSAEDAAIFVGAARGSAKASDVCMLLGLIRATDEITALRAQLASRAVGRDSAGVEGAGGDPARGEAPGSAGGER